MNGETEHLSGDQIFQGNQGNQGKNARPHLRKHHPPCGHEHKDETVGESYLVRLMNMDRVSDTLKEANPRDLSEHIPPYDTGNESPGAWESANPNDHNTF